MKIKNFQIKTLELVPKTRKFEIKQRNSELQLRYVRKGKGGSSSNWIKAPKIIGVTPELATALGIYYAEGNKSVKRWYSSFSNTEKIVILKGIKLFNSLSIKTSHLQAHIKTYGNRINDTKLIQHWSEITGIPKDNFIKTQRAIAKIVYVRNKRKPLPFGLLEVYCNSVVIRDLIDNLLEKVKSRCLENAEIRKAFLKGLFSGEGTVKLVNSKLREIRIASCNQQEQKFIRTLLQKEKIKPAAAEYDFYVAISGSKNFNLINNSGIVNLHPEKKWLFDTGYKNLLLSSGE